MSIMHCFCDFQLENISEYPLGILAVSILSAVFLALLVWAIFHDRRTDRKVAAEKEELQVQQPIYL